VPQLKRKRAEDQGSATNLEPLGRFTWSWAASTKHCGCLTTWRSAANAPDEIQNALMMLGAFVCCNGLLARRARMGLDAVAVTNNAEIREPKVDAKLEGHDHRIVTDVNGRVPMGAKIPKRSFDLQ
jgi:hypothetical protein